MARRLLALPVERDIARGLSGLLALLVALCMSVGTARAAVADEVYPYPAGVSSVVLDGHGWGHGSGMSQYGAQGAALSGLTWQQILAFYYPGATQTTDFGNPGIRVSISTLGSSVLVVRAATGLSLTVGSARTALPTTTSAGAVTRFGLWPTSTGLELRQEVGAAWSVVSVAGATALGPAATFSSSGGVLSTSAGLTGGVRSYRGTLTAYRSSSTALSVVNATTMDDYLQGVVPAESPSSWQPAALAAQAVAARTYAANRIRSASGTSDICDTTMCQVYAGVGVEASSTNAAVKATSGTVLTSGGVPISAMFSSSNGGWTVARPSTSYLVAKADPYDGIPSGSRHSWTITVARSRIEAAYPAIGSFRALRVTSRDGHGEWGGRVLTMALDGTEGSVSLSGASFASAVGLYHQWFVPTNSVRTPAWPKDFTGDGRADVLAVVAVDGSLRSYQGNGRGGFAGMTTVAGVPSGLQDVVTVGPFSQGAVADLLATKPDGTLWLLPGVDGTKVGPATQIGRGWGSYTIIGPGDWDGDGVNDVIARGADGVLWLYPGNGSGRFLPRRQIGHGWQVMSAVLPVGDLDGDGAPDLLARTSGGDLRLYPGNGTGSFRSMRKVGHGWQVMRSIVSPGDFNGDGVSDVLAERQDGTLWIYPGRGDGRWLAARQIGHGWSVMRYLVP